MRIELSVIIPSYNESANVSPMLDRLRTALTGIEWEVIYVDDNSPDGTAEKVWELALRDPRVRCLKRIGRRGLSSACIEGMLSSSAPFMAVMDADLQHDEGLLPKMLAALKSEGLDIVIGSRYVSGGALQQSWSSQRVAASRGATRFAQAVTKVKVEDPMSGFFMLRREYFHACVHRLSGRGFKILLDLLLSSPGPVKCKELPYQFRVRQHGESKLNVKVIIDYFHMIFDKSCQQAPWLPWILWAAVFIIVWAVLTTGQSICPLRR